MSDVIRKTLVYLLAAGLMVGSFFCPPQGIIDPSVLMGTSILVASYEWLFGHSIKTVDIDKSGIHIETWKYGE